MSEDYINPEDIPEILTFNEAAKLLRVSLNTLRRFTQREQNPLPAINLSNNKKPMPRIKKEDLKEWLKFQSDPRSNV